MTAALILLASSALSVAPDDCIRDYLTAVKGNAMGWFCERWDCGNREFEAADQMDLYRNVAGDVLDGNVFDLRPYSGKMILIPGNRGNIEARIAEILKAMYPNNLASDLTASTRLRHTRERDGYQEYEWKTSYTEQGFIRALVAEFKDVKPGARQPFFANPEERR